MGKPMTSAERKMKSRENKLLKMSEDEKLEFKAKERERSRKAMQSNTRKKEKTWHHRKFMISRKKKLPELEHSETKKRTANQQTNTEKAKALVQIASKKRKNL